MTMIKVENNIRKKEKLNLDCCSSGKIYLIGFEGSEATPWLCLATFDDEEGDEVKTFYYLKTMEYQTQEQLEKYYDKIVSVEEVERVTITLEG